MEAQTQITSTNRSRNYHTTVIDEAVSHAYRTEIPNLIDDMHLDVYAFRLYVHLKRVAGDNGQCWQATRELAEACNMSTGKISQAKRTLEAAGLISIELIQQSNGPAYHLIRIKDIWAKNYASFAPKSTGSSSPEPANSSRELGSSSGELKKNPCKNNSNVRDSSLRSESRTSRLSPNDDTSDSRESNVENERINTRRPTPPQAQAWAMFGALCAAFGPPTNQAVRGRYNRAAKCLIESGATPETVAQLVKAAQERGWQQRHITAMSIATHYDELLGARDSPAEPQTWQDDFGVRYRRNGAGVEYYHPGLDCWIPVARNTASPSPGRSNGLGSACGLDT